MTEQRHNRNLPKPSSRVHYCEGSDPREVAGEWLIDAIRPDDGLEQRNINALIGIGMALLALVDETRATR